MTNRKKDYKDMEKFVKTRNAQRNRYYAKTAIYEPNRWTSKQDKLVLEHTISDTESSALIGHSVKAIQIHRCRLKKAMKSLEEANWHLSSYIYLMYVTTYFLYKYANIV